MLILAVALVAAVIALYWEQLLTPEQKMQYGLVFSAADDYAARARQHPENAELLTDYVDSLVATGNLGRAFYLADLHGVKNDRLAGLREALDKSLAAREQKEVYDITADPAVAELAELPVFPAMQYLEGYQHALLGDWVSARNNFAAIEEQQLAPALRHHLRYYLARSYRLIGNAEEQSRIEGLLKSIIEDQPDPQLVSKARYNLIAWYLSDAFPAPQKANDPDPLALAKDQALLMSLGEHRWSSQKSLNELSAYALDHGDHRLAWEMSQLALLAGPEELAGKQSGEVLMGTLEAILDGSAGWGIDGDGALTMELMPGVFTALARCGARHGFAESAAGLLDRLKPHVTDRGRWEELRVGLAVCYASVDDVQGMRRLMADANLRDLSDPSLSEIYYRYALMLEADREWNTALDYYTSAFKLGGEHAATAGYRRYAIIKRVQDPLRLEQAIGYLTEVVEQYPNSDEMPKAIEELLPLLIYGNHLDAARKLIDWAPTVGQLSSYYTPELDRTRTQLAEVCHYWDAYLARRRGDSGTEADALSRIPCRYWNYYELTANYPPRPRLESGPVLLDQPECAGEYLAGLGLYDAAAEYYSDHETGNPLQQYLDYRNRSVTASLGSNQWHATELLESGMITEQPLLDYILAEAYPRPFPDEVAAASAEFGIPENLIYAVMKKESNFKPESVSWAGAHGLMQVMAPTARWLNSKYGMGIDTTDIDAPRVNIRLGTAYLASLYEIFGAGKTRWVIHGYNGGDGNVRKWRERYGEDLALFTELVPNEENEGFGKKVTRYYKMYEWLGDRDS